LRELKRKIESEKVKSEKPKVKTERDIFVEYLFDRGIEVLAAAEYQYPKETAMVVSKIVEVIKQGEIKENISGGTLLSLFRSIGLRVRMETKINVEEHGRFVSLADKLKNEK